MTVTEADREGIVRRLNDELWGEGNLDFVDEYVAEDYVEHNTASPEPIHGPEGYKENVERFHAAFSDVSVTTEQVLVDGAHVVNHYTITATHDGPYMGIEPTGAEVSVSGIAFIRFADGLIVEDWSNVDVFGLLQQLGVVEAPGT